MSSNTCFKFAEESKRFVTCFTDDESNAVQITILSKTEFSDWYDSLSAESRDWLKLQKKHEFKSGTCILVPKFNRMSEESVVEKIVCCLDGEASSPFSLCAAFGSLPEGNFKLTNFEGNNYSNPNESALSWALATYSYERFKSKESNPDILNSKLVWPSGCSRNFVVATAASTFLVRDLISTPCEYMGPGHLEEAVRDVANEFSASLRVVVGDELLKQNYPMIHAVGRAAGKGREPRLLDMTWGNEDHPKIALVGKGVCFDTGGLNLKPGNSMLYMKKDMGGAAQVLGLARMIMSQQLPVRLRLLIGAVENNVDGNAYRPGDVIYARNGKTTEIGNTDAEGRLVLGDCLCQASEDDPDLIVDCATLTGAARVALGTDLPAMFCNDEEVGLQLKRIAQSIHDHVWPMPLWAGYGNQLSSKIADMNNVSSSSYGGAIIAALYLSEFVGSVTETVSKKPLWIHLDFMGFNRSSSPGRPEGGEAMGMRGLYSFIKEKYTKQEVMP